ncbi:MAG: alkaline phosphatase D family protein, partial [Planctomycetales bacterium]|nr:alkaline phosphatase D family protein [Planctomycetales bacterium]
RGQFRTAPRDGTASKFTIAFGGGAAYLPYKERMWRTIEQAAPNLLLLLGDNVYIDDPTNEPYQRFLYYRRQCQPDFRRLTASVATYSIWDDHDFGKNDCHGGPEIDLPPWKIPVWEVYRNNWVNPAYGGGRNDRGCWYVFQRGDVKFYMLDGRYYRDPKPTNGTAPTMLGATQKKWLKQELKNSKAKLNVLCSPVPFSGGNPDKWTGFVAERDEIFTFIEDNDIRGVLLLSADRHRSDLLVHRRPNGRRYFEFMSSKLTNHHTHRPANENDGALYSYNKLCSFGLVTFDTTDRSKSRIGYQVININGEQVFEFNTSVEHQ